MWPVARSWLACVLVVCAACSLVVDFPDKAPSPEDRLDSGIDGAVKDDATTVDSRLPEADGRADSSGPGTACERNTDCASTQLCCPVASEKECVDTTVQRCGACDEGCPNAGAPNCGSRVCECIAGSGKGCDAGQICMGQGASAACVECATNADCAQKGGTKQCVANKCVQCDRGALADSASDDIGCGGSTPICGPDNVCIQCSDSSPATKCPGDLMCTPGQPCAGCKLNTPIGQANNGCVDATPVCKVIVGLPQCTGCTSNLDCKYTDKPGYCAELPGLCSDKCDPDAVTGANGCATKAAPFCKPAPAVPGGYDCAACVDADCTPSGKFCATAGPSAGSCVQCRDNTECPTSLSPVCDAVTNTCRERRMADCAATPATPYLDGTGVCVQCISSVQCPSGQQCNPSTRTCGQCAESSQCPLATPTCDATGTCIAGCTDQLCMLFHTPARRCNAAMTACVECKDSTDCTSFDAPVCSSVGTCVKCTDLPTTDLMKDAICNAKTTGTRCLRATNSTGNNIGKCGACEPGLSLCIGPTTCNATSLLCE